MPKVSVGLRNLLTDQISGLVYCDVYSGSIPATGDTSPTGTKLVSWGGTLAWSGGSSGVNTLTVPVSSDAALATGTAGYARLWDNSGLSLYCTVGTSGAEVNLSTLSVVSAGTVDIVSGTVTAPAS